MKKYRCVYMRGGTSKAVVFNIRDLPSDKGLWPELFLKVMGTPDVKQIDGMGGTVSSTSKIAVIGPSEREDADVNYTFYQVHIEKPLVADNMNCGNISSVVGPFAIDEGLVKPVEPITVVRVFNTNTNKILEEHVRVKDGKACVYGETKIQGVPGTGSQIDVFFVDPCGALTGKDFPTGKRKEILDIPDFKPIEVTMFDCVNPVVFVKSRDLGITGAEHVSLNSDKNFLQLIEKVRMFAAMKMGFIDDWEKSVNTGVTAPLLAFISESQDYTDVDGNPVAKDEMDLCCRGVNLGKVHRAYPMSLFVATAACSKLEGTIVHEMTKDTGTNEVALGHAGGSSSCVVALENGAVSKAGIIRTARKIMDGFVYVKE